MSGWTADALVLSPSRQTKLVRLLDLGLILTWSKFPGFREAFDPAEINWSVDPAPFTEPTINMETGVFALKIIGNVLAARNTYGVRIITLEDHSRLWEHRTRNMRRAGFAGGKGLNGQVLQTIYSNCPWGRLTSPNVYYYVASHHLAQNARPTGYNVEGMSNSICDKSWT